MSFNRNDSVLTEIINRLCSLKNLHIEISPKAKERLRIIYEELSLFSKNLERLLQELPEDDLGHYYYFPLVNVVIEKITELHGDLDDEILKIDNADEIIDECITDLKELDNWVAETFANKDEKKFPKGKILEYRHPEGEQQIANSQKGKHNLLKHQEQATIKKFEEEKERLLMELTSLEDFLKTIRQHISDGKIQWALNQLEKYINAHIPNMQDEIILQKSRYSNLYRENRQGIISQGKFQVEITRLSHDMLDFLKELEKELGKQQTIEKNKRDSGIYIEDEKTKDDSLINQQDTMQGSHIMNSENRTDVVIITALREEEEALLKYLNTFQEKREGGHIVYEAFIPTKDSSYSYRIIVYSLLGMGNVQAAAATGHAIATWKPTHIILTGITGGVQKDNERLLGDVVVAEQVVYYELGEQIESGVNVRYEPYRPSSTLLEAAKHLPLQDWVTNIRTPRPDGTTSRTNPQVHFGVVMSGEKVVKDLAFIEKLQSDWPKMVGIEMEGGGASTAAYVRGAASGILLVKGISDWADPNKHDNDWRTYAAEAAAAFVVELLKTGPFKSKKYSYPHEKESKPVDQSVKEDERASSRTIRNNYKFYNGQVKIKVCKKLINDWEDLADYFKIPLSDRQQFSPGRQPQGVWEWLEVRDRLHELEAALKVIGRTDLVPILRGK